MTFPDEPGGAADRPAETPRRAGSRRAWAVALGLALVVQLLVLYLPQVPAVGGGTPGLDKVVHAAAFAAVTLTAVRAGVSAWVVAAYGLAHAGVSEALQHVLLADRTGDGADVLADVAGVVLGLVLASALRRPAGR